MRKIFLLLLLMGLFLFPKPALAEESIKSFDSIIQANSDGSLEVTENIVFDYGNPTEDRHGILRQLPKVVKVGDLYRVMDFKIKEVIRDGSPETFTDKSDNKEFYIVVGHPDRHIKGVHSFQISYTVLNGIGSNYDTHDEIFWNITGNDWQVPIMEASVKIFAPILPGPKMVCYTGAQGSKEQNCSFMTDQKDTPVITTKALMSGEGLTVVWEFPKGTFPPSILQTTNPSSTANPLDPVVQTILIIIFIAVPLILNFILAPILLIRYFKTRKQSRFGSPSVNFDFPEDDKGKRITPAEAGTIDNAKLDQNDVIATIFDFAIRKYIKIEQVKKEKVLGVFGGEDDYLFVKLKNHNVGTVPFEWSLLQSFFREKDEIKLSSLQSSFYQTFSILEKEIFQSLIDRKFYTENPAVKKGLILTGAIISFITLNFILGGVVLFLYFKFNSRTALGDEADWQIDGLKIFLKNMSREHTWQAKNLITVEKYIPYAIAFGYINEFMDELKAIYPNYKPNWYSGNLAFYAISNSMISSMNTNFTTHAASSSSGFSGGGFSGGGSGGGGGGSW